MSYVYFNDKKIKIWKNRLDLSNLGINNITKIKGFEELVNLKELDLSNNNIKEIEGIENLTSFQVIKS